MHETDPLDAILAAPACPASEAAANAERLRARNALVERHRRLVYSVARGYTRSGHDIEDLAQFGQLGLIRAAEDFDAGGGYAFSTLATYRIRSAIDEGLANLRGPIRVPPGARRLRREFARREASMEAELGRPPTFAEVADAMGLTPPRRRIVRAALGARRVVEADAFETDLVGVAGAAEGADHPELRRALRFLPAAQRRVIEARYGLADGTARTLAEAGALIGLTQSRAHQLEGKALGKLRAMLGA